MSIGALAKEAVGWMTWELGSRSFYLRRLLQPIGLRTHQRWYEGRVGRVQLYGGRTAWLGAFDENYLSFELFWKGWRYYEPPTIVLAHELCRDARFFLDVGANVGYFTVSAAAWFPSLRIVSFEPNPKLNRILRENVARNGSTARVEPLALSDTSGEQRFYLPKSDMSGSLEAGFNSEVDRSITVRTAALDDLASQLELAGPVVLKIDTEGHEEAVLRGARVTLERFGPDIILEVTAGYRPETEQMLRDLGYGFHVITERGLEPTEHLTVPRQGELLYLNVLVTRLAAGPVGVLSERLRDACARLDMRATSLHRQA